MVKFKSSFVLGLFVAACSGGGNGSAPPETVNQAPTASFTQSCIQLACSFDAATSSDVDGSIVSYSWNFGDGTTSGSVSPSHDYSAPGDYMVILTVTDNAGATGSSTITVQLSTIHGESKGVLVTGTSGMPISATVLAHPDIAGFLVHQGWKDIETGKGVFDWSFIDAEWAAALANNKVIRPALHIGGDDSPKWLYDDLTIAFVLGKDGAVSSHTGNLTFSGNTVSVAGAVWPADLVPSKIIEITGTPNNDGRYRIATDTVSSFVVEESFVNEAGVSGTINLDVVPSYWDAQYIQHKSDFYNALNDHLFSLGQASQDAMLALPISMVAPNTGDWAFRDTQEHIASYNAAGWLTGSEAEKQAGLTVFLEAMKTLYSNVVPNIAGSIQFSSAIGPVPRSLLPSGMNSNQPVQEIISYLDQQYPDKFLVGKGALNARTYFANPCPAIGSSWEAICSTPNFLQINWSVSGNLFNANGKHEWDKSNHQATATILKNAGLNAYSYNAKWFEIWHADVDGNNVTSDAVLQDELNIAVSYIKELLESGPGSVGAPIAVQAPSSTLNLPVGTKFVLQYVFDYNGSVPDMIEVRKDSVVVGTDLSFTIQNPVAADSGFYEIACRNSVGTTIISSQINFQ